MKAIYILLACAVLMSTLNYISADALNHENSKLEEEVGLKFYKLNFCLFVCFNFYFHKRSTQFQMKTLESY